MLDTQGTVRQNALRSKRTQNGGKTRERHSIGWLLCTLAAGKDKPQIQPTTRAQYTELPKYPYKTGRGIWWGIGRDIVQHSTYMFLSFIFNKPPARNDETEQQRMYLVMNTQTKEYRIQLATIPVHPRCRGTRIVTAVASRFTFLPTLIWCRFLKRFLLSSRSSNKQQVVSHCTTTSHKAGRCVVILV